jgi:hypothetical protein
MSEWTALVKKMYNANKHKPGYKLGHAMRDSKKVYKNTVRAFTGKKHRTARRGRNTHRTARRHR